MATARMTVGSLLGTITNAANMVSNVVNTASGGVDMLNRFVESASIDQRERHVAHRASFRSSLIREASMEIAKGDAEVLAFCRVSEDNMQLFTAAQQNLVEAFSKFDGIKS